VFQVQAVCAKLSAQNGLEVVLKAVILQTSARNLSALKFYEECGYQRQGLKTGYYGGVSSPIAVAYIRGKTLFQ
jgi:ribosomal protein S18 acetylase RimI-like enzyme